MPKGKYCKPCGGAWLAGGWEDEYHSADKFLSDTKNDMALQEEFNEPREEFVRMSNNGEIPEKVRRCTSDRMGIKKNRWQKRLQEKRHNRRKLLKNSGRRVGIGSKMKCQSVLRYAQTHGGRTPEMDGLVPKKRKIRGVEHMTVLVDPNPEGEWDYADEDFEEVVEQETLDEGTALLSANQIDRKATAEAKP